MLLVRLDGVGDAAVCTPLLVALRAAGHQVGVALTTRNAGIFAPDAILAQHILERIPWPRHGSTFASSARARREIVAQHYDAALIASEEPEAYALARGIAARVGFSTGWTRPLKSLWVRRALTRTVSRSQRAGRAGAHEAEVMYRLGAGFTRAAQAPTDGPALREAIAGSAPPRRDGAAIVLQAGAKWAASGVAPTTLRALAGALAPRGLRVVAAPSERAAAAAELGVAVESFAGLRDWIAALDAGAAVVTTDTGAAHVAGMLGVPVVDVFADAHFAAQVQRWRPWAAPFRALRASELSGGGAVAALEAALYAF